MNDPQPLVSVVVANYNYARYLADALDSVMAQTYQPLEIIVVDDGSTDDSRDVIARYAVHAIFQPNAGQAAALNVGVAAASGDIVCLLDADDGWAPVKVARTVATLAEQSAAMWIRHELSVVDAGRRPTGQVVPRLRGSRRVGPSAAAVAERVITASTSGIAFRRSAAPHVFPLEPTARFRYDADALIVARLGSRFRGWQLDDALGFYRRHEGQQYAGEARLKRQLERQIEVGGLLADALGRGEPVSNYKHRAIVAALDGGSVSAELARGLVASLRLVPQPVLMARQVMGLLLAGAAPQWWLGKLRRQQSLP